MPKTKNFVEVIKGKLAANPALAAKVEEHAFQSNLAEQIYGARTEAGLTQAQLATLIESHQSVIARLEDADYDGHSLSMLRRIATVLGRSLRVEFSKSPHDINSANCANQVIHGDLPKVQKGKSKAQRVAIKRPTASKHPKTSRAKKG